MLVPYQRADAPHLRLKGTHNADFFRGNQPRGNEALGVFAGEKRFAGVEPPAAVALEVVDGGVVVEEERPVGTGPVGPGMEAGGGLGRGGGDEGVGVE